MIKKLLYGIAFITVLMACDKDSNNTVPAMPELLLLNAHEFELPEEGGSFFVEINGVIECMVEISSSCRSWLSEQPTSKATGQVRTFRVRANTDGGAREGQIVFSNQTLKDTVYVVQAGVSDASVLLLNRHRVEFSEAGGNFSVEVGTNTAYETRIPLTSRSWIKEISGAEELAVHKHSFAVAPNQNYEPRNGCIIFYNDEQADTVYVTQAATPAPNTFVFKLSEYEFEAAGNGEILSVEVESDIDYTVTIPEDFQLWITEEPVTQNTSTHIHRFRLDKNQSFKERTGYVIFGNDTLIQRVYFNQAAKFVWGEDFTEEIAPGINIDMVYVEGGTFTMGSDESEYDENVKPAHRVTLSDYYIGKYEVTFGLLKALVWYTTESVPDNYPAWIKWSKIQFFFDHLNKLSNQHYTLPTEAQWEFAAIGGNKSKGYKYSGSDNLDEVGWYQENDNSEHPVGQKKSNELGIYDMSGNKSEVCLDLYGPYTAEEQFNPTGSTEGIHCILRGGTSNSSKYSTECTTKSRKRGNLESDLRVGFRLALSRSILDN